MNTLNENKQDETQYGIEYNRERKRWLEELEKIPEFQAFCHDYTVNLPARVTSLWNHRDKNGRVAHAELLDGISCFREYVHGIMNAATDDYDTLETEAEHEVDEQGDL